jgi:uncharacterized membrane protein YccC
MQRLLATLVGGGLALATLVLSADKPWLLFPTHGIVVGGALFLSRTSTAPYAFLLLAVTFVLVLPVYPLHPDASLAVVLWRMALTSLGVVIGTAAQLLLWPDDPEALLLADLGRRLDERSASSAGSCRIPRAPRRRPTTTSSPRGSRASSTCSRTPRRGAAGCARATPSR